MNREILFRGQSAIGREWIYGFYVKDDEDTLIAQWNDKDGKFDYYAVIPSTIGQFTGLTDKNGVKIWEGDRLRIPADLWIGGQSVGKNKGTFNDDAFVEYHGGSFRINQIGNDAKLYYGVIDFSTNTGADVAEVIGTIHDTHLIKQS